MENSQPSPEILKDKGLQHIQKVLHSLDKAPGYYVAISKLHEDKEGNHRLDHLVYLGAGYKYADTAIALQAFKDETNVIIKKQEETRTAINKENTEKASEAGGKDSEK